MSISFLLKTVSAGALFLILAGISGCRSEFGDTPRDSSSPNPYRTAGRTTTRPEHADMAEYLQLINNLESDRAAAVERTKGKGFDVYGVLEQIDRGAAGSPLAGDLPLLSTYHLQQSLHEVAAALNKTHAPPDCVRLEDLYAGYLDLWLEACDVLSACEKAEKGNLSKPEKEALAEHAQALGDRMRRSEVATSAEAQVEATIAGSTPFRIGD